MKNFFSKLAYYFTHPVTTVLFIIWGTINIITAPTLTVAVISGVITALIGIMFYYELKTTK